MDKEFKDIILYEIRQNRKAIRDLERTSTVLSVKFKLVVLGASLLSGAIGSILISKLTKFL